MPRQAIHVLSVRAGRSSLPRSEEERVEPSDQADDGSPVSLSLTKALVEANRAKFHIRTGAGTGTLIEVVFSHSVVE